jgi:hypothetical protein
MAEVVLAGHVRRATAGDRHDPTVGPDLDQSGVRPLDVEQPHHGPLGLADRQIGGGGGTRTDAQGTKRDEGCESERGKPAGG